MSLTSPVLLAIVAGLAVLLPVLLIITWRRRPDGVGGALLRLVGVLVCQVLAVGGVGLWANNEYGFYNDWNDVIGEPADADDGPVTGAIDTTDLVPGDGSQGTLKVFTAKVPGGDGPTSARLDVMAWLPKQYSDPANKKQSFPVLLMLPGQPSKPETLFSDFDFGEQANKAIDSGAVAPFVAIFPPLMIAAPRDTECMDSFSAAAGVAGYYDALTDDTTGDLFKGDKKLQNENSPLWLIQQDPGKQTNLLIVVSSKDQSSYEPGKPYANSKQMIETTQDTPGVSSIVLASGGHHYDTYIDSIPNILSWLAQNGSL